MRQSAGDDAAVASMFHDAGSDLQARLEAGHRVLCRDEFDGGDEALAADLTDQRMIAEGFLQQLVEIGAAG